MRVRTKVGKLFMALLAIEPEEDDLLQEEVDGGETQLAPLPEMGQPEPPGEEPVIEAAEPVTLEEPVVEAAEPVTREEQPALQAAEAERGASLARGRLSPVRSCFVHASI